MGRSYVPHAEHDDDQTDRHRDQRDAEENRPEGID